MDVVSYEVESRLTLRGGLEEVQHRGALDLVEARVIARCFQSLSPAAEVTVAGVYTPGMWVYNPMSDVLVKTRTKAWGW